MKVLHAVYSAEPDPPGGTEIYVTGLCAELRREHVASVIGAPGIGGPPTDSHGTPVRRFHVDAPATLDQLYAGDRAVAAAFERVVVEESPDLFHQHALSPACSVELARQARRHGLPVVFTYHTPAVSCQRGTLMEGGRAACDGKLDVSRCCACTLQALGAGESSSRMLALMPEAGGRLIGSLGLEGGAWTALRMSSLMTMRHQELRELFDLVDQFVVLTPWVADVLRINGVREDKLTVSTHGVQSSNAARDVGPDRRGPLRIAHLGRIDPTKGTGLLMQALRALPGQNVALDIYGIVQSAAGGALFDELARVASEDPRIALLPPIPHADVIPTLAAYDLLAIPSKWMETGPLVALEASAAGVAVLGSDLGGLADKIQDGVNGLLVRPFDSVDAWRDAIARCVRDRELPERLARGVTTPKSMTDVAVEMSALYARLVGRTKSQPAPMAGSR
jgi:glycosyltransferase involved in cell wall biosynthesis